jgi:formate dehydrogenase iron-sulfur subunit
MKAILMDVTRCTGCESCVDACIGTNELDQARALHDRAAVADGLSAERYLSVLRVGEGRFARKSCLHCLEPSCVAACLVGGLTKSANGPVVYDPEKCIGCRYCMIACPFEIPRYEWDATRPYVHKCDMCAGRQREGLAPACVAACPHGALLFGERDALITEAHARIAAGKKAYRPHIWGEHEVGGTSVLYIADVALDRLDWPDPSDRPIPTLTTPLIEKTPAIGLSVATGLLGINWVIRRRMRRQAEDTARATESEDATAVSMPGKDAKHDRE